MTVSLMKWWTYIVAGALIGVSLSSVWQYGGGFALGFAFCAVVVAFSLGIRLADSLWRQP